MEREHHARQPLHQQAKHKSNGHRHENGQYDRECLFRVDQPCVSQRRVMKHLDQSQCRTPPQKFKHHGHRRRSRHTQSVENVHQYHIRGHHGQKNAHQFLKRKKLGAEYPVPGYVHHTVARGGTHKNTNGSNHQNRLEPCHFRPNGGTQKIHRVIADSHIQVENG